MNLKSLTDPYLKSLSSPRRFSLCDIPKHWKGLVGDNHKLAESAISRDESLWDLLQRLSSIDTVKQLAAGPERDSLVSNLAYLKFTQQGKLEYTISGLDFSKTQDREQPVRWLMGNQLDRCYYIHISPDSTSIPMIPSPSSQGWFALEGAYILEKHTELTPGETCDHRAKISALGGPGVSIDIVLAGSPKDHTCAVDDTYIHVTVCCQDIDTPLSDAGILFTDGTSLERRAAALVALKCIAECTHSIRKSPAVISADVGALPKSFSGLGFTQSALFRKKLRNQWQRHVVVV